jgi:hypothetical protein
MILRESSQGSVGATLGLLPALTSLTIAFRLEQGYDNGSVLRSIVVACPHLQHLDFSVAYRPSFTIVNEPPASPLDKRSHMPPLIVSQERFARCMPRPTAHPCTTHRTLSRRTILTLKQRTHCARKPTLRILRARLPPSHEHPRRLLPHSNSPHITITLDIITPQLHSHARASPLRPLSRAVTLDLLIGVGIPILQIIALSVLNSL